MEALVLTTLALAALALVAMMVRRPQVATVSAAPADEAAPVAPVRITHPRRANRSDVKVWVLKASPACELTHEFLHNRRYRVDEAIALPAVGCNLADCRCSYHPVSDTRRRDRRHADDRRNQIRFEKRSDRRARDDRRHADVWQHGLLR